MSRAIPPLILIAQGRKPRLRRTLVDRPLEIKLHMSVAKLLRDHAKPTWQWAHYPSGELRDKRTAGKLKQMGSKAGWPDFILVPPVGQLHCLELKRKGEALSEEQDNFRIWCFRSGVPHVVAYSLDEVLIAFDAWGCLSIKIAKRAPGGANNPNRDGETGRLLPKQEALNVDNINVEEGLPERPTGTSREAGLRTPQKHAPEGGAG